MESPSHSVKPFRNYNFTLHSTNSAYPEMEIENPIIIGERKVGTL
jgi:hypothetical protein